MRFAPSFYFPYRYRVAIFLCLLMIITYMDRICISLVGVRIKSDFHLTNGQFGWALGAFSLSYALFEIPAGIWGDRIGQRAMLIRIVLWWSLFTALTGLSVGLVSLIVLRFLFGAGEAGSVPNMAAAVSRWFPKKDTSKGLSIGIAGQYMGSAIAPLIVVRLAESYGWRLPFFVNALFGLAWVVICVWWFRNNPSEMQGISIDERVLIESNRRWLSKGQHMPWRKLFKSRSLVSLFLCFSASQWSNYFFIAWMPVYLQEAKHFSEKDMQLTFTLVFSLAIAGSLLGGFLSDALSRKKGLRWGRSYFGMFVLGLLGVSILTQTLTDNHLVIICLLACGVFLQAMHGIPSFSVCVDIAGSRAGTLSGVMNFCGQMAAFLIVILFGQIADSAKNFNASLWVLGIVLLIGALLWLAVDPSMTLMPEEV